MTRTSLILCSALALGACVQTVDKTSDRGFDRKNLSALSAGIWVDPNGCQHWIIDDGFEGYLSARLHKNGLPVCTDDFAPPNSTTGDFKEGTGIPDPI
jgi:hypothetical protein